MKKSELKQIILTELKRYLVLEDKPTTGWVFDQNNTVKLLAKAMGQGFKVGLGYEYDNRVEFNFNSWHGEKFPNLKEFIKVVKTIPGILKYVNISKAHQILGQADSKRVRTFVIPKLPQYFMKPTKYYNVL